MSLDIELHDINEIEYECEECGHKKMIKPLVFEYNITHNLGKMAEEADVYQAIWRPEELKIDKALHLINHLKHGMNNLRANPEHFRKFNPDNGWGRYEDLLLLVEQYLEACMEFPEADITVWR